MEAELTLGYLDDVTLGDSQSFIAKDVQRVIEEGRRIGLLLNVSKCELIADPNTTVTDPVLRSFHRVTV
jgi:hypothetical protein